jgi:hypothetical protein
MIFSWESGSWKVWVVSRQDVSASSGARSISGTSSVALGDRADAELAPRAYVRSLRRVDLDLVGLPSRSPGSG